MVRSLFSRRPNSPTAAATPRFEGIESLEQRLCLATYVWDGLGDGVSITDRANWHNNHLPGPDDTAIIESEDDLALVLNGGSFEVNTLILSETLTINGGSLSIFSDSEVSGQLDLLNGEINGGGDLNITGIMNWNAGRVAGAGDIVVAPGGRLNIAGNGVMPLERDIINHGATRWFSGNLVGSGSSGTVINNAPGGVFRVMGQSTLKAGYWPAAFINEGLFVRDGADAARFLVPFHNSGTLNVASGTLQLWGGGSNAGARNVAQGALLHYFGDFTHNAGSTLAGGGETIWQGGTHTINADWTMDSYLYLSNATVTGPGLWTIDGVLGWSHGTLEGRGGTVIGATGKIEIRTLGEHTLARDIVNNGVLIWNRGPLTFAGATITNNAQFYIAADATAYSSSPDDRIINHNELRKVLPTSAGFGGVTLDNDGLVAVHNGSLTLSQGALAQLVGTTLTGGDWRVFNHGTLSLSGAQVQTIGAAASITRFGPSAGLGALASLTRIEGSLRVLAGGSLDVAPAGGTFTNAGYLFLNHSTKLNIDGEYIQTAAGTLDIGVASPFMQSAGCVIIAESTTLDGTLSITLEQGFIPLPGCEFSVLQAQSVSGQFAALNVSQTATALYQIDRVLVRYI